MAPARYHAPATGRHGVNAVREVGHIPTLRRKDRQRASSFLHMRRHLPFTLAALAATAALIPAATAQADGVKRTAAGAAPADITAAVNAFRADIGGNNNAGGPAAASGRREINWDGVPDSNADPNPFPAGTFLGRGILFDTPGTGFKVSANAGNPTATPVRFGNAEFQVFSPQKLFAPTGSNVYDSHFFVPGTSTPATTHGFGVVFTDVDVTGSAKIEYFDPAGALLDTAVAPASPNGGLSFAGESFNAGERIGRVRVTSGTTTTLTSDPAGQDAVAQDDFVYGEPLAGLIAFRLDAERVQEDGATAALTVTRQGANAGTATVAYATADGTAKAGQDYAAKTGTVTFGPGETTKQIKIAISADNANEQDESFTVALSNASGAALAAPRTETVTIQDRTPAKKGKLKVRVFRLLSPGLRFAIASDGDGSYRYKLTLTSAQAKKLGLKKRTLASSGSRTLHSGANTLTVALGGKLKAKLHKAHIKPKLTIAIGDGTSVRQRVAL
jgi:Calx-beta domain-containing protein